MFRTCTVLKTRKKTTICDKKRRTFFNILLFDAIKGKWVFDYSLTVLSMLQMRSTTLLE